MRIMMNDDDDVYAKIIHDSEAERNYITPISSFHGRLSYLEKMLVAILFRSSNLVNAHADSLSNNAMTSVGAHGPESAGVEVEAVRSSTPTSPRSKR